MSVLHRLTYAVTGLTQATEYTFKVEAGDAGGNWSTTGPSRTATTLAEEPGTGILLASALPGGLVNLNWEASRTPGLAGYRVLRGTTTIATLSSSALSYQDSGRAAETTYTYSIVAFDSPGNQWTHTSQVSVTTPPLSITSLSWQVPRGPGSLALLRETLAILLKAEPNRQAQAQVSYQTWFDQGGNLLPQPRVAQTTVSLTEDPASSGDYKDNFVLAVGTARIDFLAASLSDGAGHTASRTASGLPLEVAGRLVVEVVSPPTNLLTGATLLAWSDSLGNGKRTALTGPGTYPLSLLAAADYAVRILGTDGRALAERKGIGISPGMEATLSLTPQLPATLRVRVVAPNGSPVPGLIVTFTNSATGAWLMLDRSGEDGWSPKLERLLSGESILATVQAPLPYRTGISQSFALAAGDNQGTIQLTRLSEGTLQGRATRPDGSPVAGVRVTATQEDNGRRWAQSTETGADGRYSLSLLAGLAGVEAASPDQRLASPTGLSVMVPEGGTATQDLALASLETGTIFAEIYTRYVGATWQGPLAMDGRQAMRFNLQVTDGRGQTIPAGSVYPISISGRAGDTVEVCVDGRNLALPADCQKVQLDSQRRATATFRLEQAGVIQGRAIDGATGMPLSGMANVAVYSVDAQDIRNLVYSRSMPAVNMQAPVPKPGLYDVEVHGASSIGKVRALVSSGELVNVGDILLLARGVFQGQQGNGLTAVTGEVSPGGRVGFRATYQNSGSAVENVRLRLEVPGGTTFVAGSVTLNGQQVNPTVSGSTLEVPLGNLVAGASGRATYQVVLDTALDRQAVGATARIAYRAAGVEKEEVLGTVEVKVSQVSLVASPRLNTLNTTLSGRAPVGSTVRAYDGTVLLGEAQASPGGFWQMSVTLPDMGSPRRHSLHAEARAGSEVLQSEQVVVLYDRDQPKLLELCIQQNIKSYCFDPSSGVAHFPFTLGFLWRQEGFVFTLRFDNPSRVFNVKVRLGNTEFPATLHSSGRFVATTGPIKKDLGGISVSYDTKPNPALARQPKPTEAELRRNLPPWMGDFSLLPGSPPVNGNCNQGPVTQSLKFALPQLNNAEVQVELTVQCGLSYTTTPQDETFVQESGLPVYGFSWGASEVGGEMVGQIQGYIPASAIDTGGSSGALPGKRFLGILLRPVTSVEKGLVSNAVRVSARVATSHGNQVLDAVDLYRKVTGTWDQLDTYGQLQLLYKLNERLANIEPAAAEANVAQLNNLAYALTAKEFVTGAVDVAGVFLAPETLGLGTLAAWGISYLGDVTVDWLVSKSLETLRETTLSQIERYSEQRGIEVDIDEILREVMVSQGLLADPAWLHDPSGYVYEAVPENRIEGVTATALQGTTQNGPWTVWDAAWFGQQNPQVTDAEGSYGWDVPQGWWQVAYRKDGYQTAYSQVLQVPPPHFDVNVGIVSLAPPQISTVTGMLASDLSIQIEFDMYMRASTLTGSTVAVSPIGGSPLSGSVVAVNPVTDPNGVLVTRVARFTPTTPLTIGASYQVLVSQLVQSYSGIPMTADFTGVITAPDLVVPSWPSNASLVASNIGQTSLTLSWTAASDNVGISGYRVYRNGSLLASVGGNVLAYSVSNLSPGTQYTFRVESGDAAGNWTSNGPSTAALTLSSATPTPTPSPTPTPYPTPTPFPPLIVVPKEEVKAPEPEGGVVSVVHPSQPASVMLPDQGVSLEIPAPVQQKTFQLRLGAGGGVILPVPPPGAGGQGDKD